MITPPPTTHCPPRTEFLTLAHELADASGAVIRPYFGAHGAVETKADQSPVTQADRAAEAIMRDMISARYPGHAIYGEEFGQSVNNRRVGEAEPREARQRSASEASKGGASPPSRNNYTWVLDPIDGTRAFIAGRKEWGTLIALCENGVPILGILDQPVTGERWVGIAGEPSTYNFAPIHSRACASLAQASISTTSRHYFTPPQAAKFIALANQCAQVIEDGDCYAYGLLARGMRDLVIDAGLKPYDILALVPIIHGAGGTITGWDGAPITLQHYASAIAAGDTTCYAAAFASLAP